MSSPVNSMISDSTMRHTYSAQQNTREQHDSLAPTVSVIIPTRNADHDLRKCLDYIAAQDYQGPIEVVVAEANEHIKLAEKLQKSHPDVKVVPNPDKIITTGIIAGIRASSGEYIARCDAHTFLPSDYLRKAISTLQRTGAANVGGRQAAIGSTFFERAAAIAMTSPIGAGDARHRGLNRKEGPSDSAFLGVYRRIDLEEVGGYNPRLVRNEDYELNYKFRKHGKTVWFNPELVVNYRPRSTLKQLAKQYFNYGRSKSFLIINHPGSIRIRHLTAPGFILSLVVLSIIAVFGSLLPLIAFLGLYAATIVIATAIEWTRRKDPSAILLPLIVPTMHLCWGAGIYVPEEAFQPIANSPAPTHEVIP